ncbi:MAG TPA: copper resistance protein CopC, partial [Chloroflexota bacterium]
MRAILSLLIGAALAVALFPAAAGAHANYVRSEPAANAIADAAPATMRLWFGENLDMAGTQVTLYGPGGPVAPAAAP